jgi:hypothetical protein
MFRQNCTALSIGYVQVADRHTGTNTAATAQLISSNVEQKTKHQHHIKFSMVGVTTNVIDNKFSFFTLVEAHSQPRIGHDVLYCATRYTSPISKLKIVQ